MSVYSNNIIGSLLTSEDDRVSGGGAAGEHGAGLALVRPGHCQGGGAVRGQRQSVIIIFIIIIILMLDSPG